MSSNQTSFRLPSAYTIPEYIDHEGKKIRLPSQIRDNDRVLFNGLLDAHQAIVTLNTKLAGLKGGTTINNIIQGGGGSSAVSFNTPGLGFFFGPGIFLPISAISRSTGASWVPVPNQVSVIQFVLDVTFQISKVSINIIANAIGKHAGFGIYSGDGNTKIIDSGPMALDSITVLTSSIGPFVLAPGTYFYAQTSDTTTATLNTSSSVSLNDAALMNANSSFPRYAVAANASVAGQLPTTLGTLTAVSAPTIFDTALVMFEP